MNISPNFDVKLVRQREQVFYEFALGELRPQRAPPVLAPRTRPLAVPVSGSGSNAVVRSSGGFALSSFSGFARRKASGRDVLGAARAVLQRAAQRVREKHPSVVFLLVSNGCIAFIRSPVGCGGDTARPTHCLPAFLRRPTSGAAVVHGGEPQNCRLDRRSALRADRARGAGVAFGKRVE
jgi:hypothetical protein